MAEDGSAVALVLWQDVVKGRDGKLVYHDDSELDAEWRKRPGHGERIRHLAHCRDELNGRFRVVIARAVDREADPRDIASCHPQEGVWWSSMNSTKRRELSAPTSLKRILDGPSWVHPKTPL